VIRAESDESFNNFFDIRHRPWHHSVIVVGVSEVKMYPGILGSSESLNDVMLLWLSVKVGWLEVPSPSTAMFPASVVPWGILMVISPAAPRGDGQ
jgi:hypothetical protein